MNLKKNTIKTKKKRKEEWRQELRTRESGYRVNLANSLWLVFCAWPPYQSTAHQVSRSKYLVQYKKGTEKWIQIGFQYPCSSFLKKFKLFGAISLGKNTHYLNCLTISLWIRSQKSSTVLFLDDKITGSS